MKLKSLYEHYNKVKFATVLASLLLVPTTSYAALIYEIDAGQSFDTDSTQISGFVVWDETLSSITEWHFETLSGYGIHNVSTEGATYDSSGPSDTLTDGEALQTYLTITPTASHELDILWDTSPADALSSITWSIQETWILDNYAGVHWRTGTVSASLVSTVPLPASIFLFGSGLALLMGLVKHKSCLVIKKA